MAIVERAVHSKEYTVTTNEVAAHWHKHFPEEASESERVLNDQTVAFFQIAEGADLGKITIGRQGHATRFDFLPENIAVMVDGAEEPEAAEAKPAVEEVPEHDERPAKVIEMPASPAAVAGQQANNRVFITHGKNKKILEQG